MHADTVSRAFQSAVQVRAEVTVQSAGSIALTVTKAQGGQHLHSRERRGCNVHGDHTCRASYQGREGGCTGSRRDQKQGSDVSETARDLLPAFARYQLLCDPAATGREDEDAGGVSRRSRDLAQGLPTDETVREAVRSGTADQVAQRDGISEKVRNDHASRATARARSAERDVGHAFRVRADDCSGVDELQAHGQLHARALPEAFRPVQVEDRRRRAHSNLATFMIPLEICSPRKTTRPSGPVRLRSAVEQDGVPDIRTYILRTRHNGTTSPATVRPPFRPSRESGRARCVRAGTVTGMRGC